MTTPTIRFDQGDTGTVDRSRTDIAISTAVTIVAANVTGTAVFGLLDKPLGSSAVLSGTGLTRTITPDVAGPYRVRIIDDDDNGEVVHTFKVRTAASALGLALVAHNERANPEANDVENDAADIAASESNEGGTFKGWHTDLTADLLKIDQAVGEIRNATTLDFYVKDVGGNDSNDGLTPATALKTITAVVPKIPYLVKNRIIIHVGDHSAAGYEVPEFGAHDMQGHLSLIGDGAGTGDGWTETLASEAAAVGTDETKVVSSTGGHTIDAFLGHTMLYETGDCAGYQRHVHSNTATDFLPVVDTDQLGLSPASGDTFRVVRPSVKLDLSFGGKTVGTRMIGGKSLGFPQAEGDSSGAFVWSQFSVDSTNGVNLEFSGIEMAVVGGEQLNSSGGRLDWRFLNHAQAYFGCARNSNSAGQASVELGAPDTAAWVGYGHYRADTGSKNDGSPWMGDAHANVKCYIVSSKTIDVRAQVTVLGGRIIGGIEVFGTTRFDASPIGAASNRIKITSSGSTKCIHLKSDSYAELRNVDLESEDGDTIKVERDASLYDNGCAGGPTGSGLGVLVKSAGRYHSKVQSAITGTHRVEGRPDFVATFLVNAGDGVYDDNGSGIGIDGGGSVVRSSFDRDDDVVFISSAADITKKMRYDVSDITTATTRTITVPDADVDLGDIATNNAKVTNATHTGDVTGATVLTVTEAGVTQHEAAIDHDALTNHVAGQHRIINDAGTSTTELWSADKIDTTISALGWSPDYLTGLGQSQGADAVNDTVVASGQCRDADDTFDMVAGSSMTAAMDAATGAGGLDTGTVSADTTYYVWFIVDSAAVNPPAAMYSLSVTAPTMPSGYDKKRRVGTAIAATAGTLAAVYRQVVLGNTRKYYWTGDDWRSNSVLSSGTASSFTTVSGIVDEWAPPAPAAVKWLVNVEGTGASLFGAINGRVYVKPQGWGSQDLWFVDCGSNVGGDNRNSELFEMPPGDDDTLQYRRSNSANCSIYMVGWLEVI